MTDLAQRTLTIPEWTRGERLRKARKHAGLSLEQMASRFGVTDGSVSNWENASRSATNWR